MLFFVLREIALEPAGISLNPLVTESVRQKFTSAKYLKAVFNHTLPTFYFCL